MLLQFSLWDPPEPFAAEETAFAELLYLCIVTICHSAFVCIALHMSQMFQGAIIKRKLLHAQMSARPAPDVGLTSLRWFMHSACLQFSHDTVVSVTPDDIGAGRCWE